MHAEPGGGSAAPACDEDAGGHEDAGREAASHRCSAHWSAFSPSRRGGGGKRKRTVGDDHYVVEVEDAAVKRLLAVEEDHRWERAWWTNV